MGNPNRIGGILIGLLGTLAIAVVALVSWQWNSGDAPPEGVTPGSNSGRPADRQIAPSPRPSPASSPGFFASPLPESDDGTVRELNDQGLAHYSQGEFAVAADRFQEALRFKPSDPVLLRNLSYAKGSQGWKLIEDGELREALLLFEEASRLLEDEAAFYIGRGLIFHRLQEDESAVAMLEKAVSLRADNPQPYLILGDIYYERDELDLAVGYLEKAADLLPNDAALQDRLAKTRRENRTQGSFRQQSTLHFSIRFEGSEQYDVAQVITDLLEEAYMDVGRLFFHYPESTIPVLLYSDQQFTDVTLTPSWSKGLFDGKIRIPIEGFERNPGLLKKVLRHEYVHALVFDLCPAPIPTWLNEGLALGLEGGTGSTWDQTLRKHLRSGSDLIPLRELGESFLSFSNARAELAYAESYSATQLLIQRYGMYRIKDLLVDVANGTDFYQSFETHFLTSFSEFERTWQFQIGS